LVPLAARWLRVTSLLMTSLLMTSQLASIKTFRT
jgi:hypothetical protein